MADRLITPDEVSTLPRGRKPNLDQNVLKQLGTLVKQPEGILRMEETFGKVPADDKASVGAEIRKHWKHLTKGATKVRIRYAQDGVPQVFGPKAPK